MTKSKDITKEYLLEHYVKLDKSAEQICGELSIKSKTVIFRLLKKYNIPSYTQRKGKPVPNGRTVGHEEISGAYWNRVKIGAKNRNHEFDITIQHIWELYIKQNRKCFLSGLDIGFIDIWDSKLLHNQTASLDRIDNDKGYIIGNVQWLHKDINRLKHTFTQSDFIKYCKLVARSHA